MDEGDMTCAGCGEESPRRRYYQGRFYGLKCCYNPRKPGEKVGMYIMKMHPLKKHPRFTEADYQRIATRRPTPEGNAAPDSRWRAHGDFKR